MLKRFVPLLILAASFAYAPAQAHPCVRATAVYSLEIDLGEGLTITISEQGPLNTLFFAPAPPPTEVCSDGTDTAAFQGSLIIERDGVELCRNDNVDPSFDPFMFGAGIDVTGSCAATFSASSLSDPLLPDAGSGFSNGRLLVGTTRTVAVTADGVYNAGGTSGTIFEGTPGTSKRGMSFGGEL